MYHQKSSPNNIHSFPVIDLRNSLLQLGSILRLYLLDNRHCKVQFHRLTTLDLLPMLNHQNTLVLFFRMLALQSPDQSKSMESRCIWSNSIFHSCFKMFFCHLSKFFITCFPHLPRTEVEYLVDSQQSIDSCHALLILPKLE